MPSVQQIEDKTSDFNDYYHMAGDTVDHMDAEYWQAMMRGLVATIATWAGPALAAPTAAPTTPATPEPSVTATRPPTAPPAPTPSATTAATAPPPRHLAHLPIAYSGRR